MRFSLSRQAFSPGFSGTPREWRPIARVLYGTLAEGRIVVIHQFIKKTEKTPSKELDIARRRMNEVKHG